MAELLFRWYDVLGTVGRALTLPIQDLTASLGGAPLTPVLLGILGGFSPCQISTGIGAVALIGRQPDRHTFTRGLAYVAGKSVVYALLGLAVVVLGRGLEQSTIPFIVVLRRVIGPIMILAGLVMLGAWRPGFGFVPGQRLAAAAADRFDGRTHRGAFALGAAFSFAFCPTLFLLFFGLVMPLTTSAPLGAAYPPLFALGTGTPLLVALGAVAFGARSGGFRSGSLRLAASRVAGVLLLIAGLNDTLLYTFG